MNPPSTSASSTRPRPSGLVGLLVAASLIAFSPILAVLAGSWAGLEPVVTATYRVVLAAPLFLLANAFRPKKPDTFKLDRWQKVWLVVPGVFFALDLACWHASMGIIAAGVSTFLSNLSALFVPLLTWLLFRERPSKRFAMGTMVALIGTSMLLLPPDTRVLQTLPRGGQDYALGNALGVGTALMYAAYQLSVMHVRRFADTLTVMTMSTLTSALLLSCFTLWSDARLVPQAPSGWWPLVGLALVSQVAGQGLIAWSLGRVKASHAAVILLWQPTLAALLGGLILGQGMSWMQTAGIAPVVLGLFLVATSRRKTTAQAADGSAARSS